MFQFVNIYFIASDIIFFAGRIKSHNSQLNSPVVWGLLDISHIAQLLQVIVVDLNS